MRCPFLREAQVKYCRASAFRKMIVRVPGQPDTDRCSSPDYVNCRAAQPLVDTQTLGTHCPLLQEALTQYCGAASVAKYIPYSEAVLSHCGTESHKYCELYLSLAHPEHMSFQNHTTALEPQINAAREYQIQGISVPGHLFYSANHMWIDISSDGVVHVGIDAFLASMIDSIDQISYVTLQGLQRPTVVLTVHGVDLQMMFPNPIVISNANLYLRTHPSTILSDPYTLGWLFEGSIEGHEAEAQRESLKKGLLTGERAAEWMDSELRRATQAAHEFSCAKDSAGHVAMADGGSVQPGFVQYLTRDEILRVFNDFFSPLACWRQ
jgi:glycine cleavage system H lipoate-binding protein